MQKVLKRAKETASSTDIPLLKCACCKCDTIGNIDGKYCSELCKNKYEAATGTLDAYKRAGIPRLYWGAKLSDFGQLAPNGRVALEMLKQNQHVSLIGNTGVGKTHMAAALSICMLPTLAIELGYNFIWVRCPDLLMEIRATYRDNSKKSEGQVVEWFRKVGLLVLDDLGAEKMTDWSVSSLYTIIAGRIDECLPTIITSNLRLKEINEWEPRIASRMVEFYGVELPDVDRRIEKAKERKVA